MSVATKTKFISRRQIIYEWLKKQASLLNIQVSLLTHQVQVSEGRLYLPVYVGNATDAYDAVMKLQELEDGWNYQEPAPNLRLFLVPADEKPAWLEAHAPLQEAEDRYYEAFDAYSRTAVGSEEEKKALEDLEAAKAAKLEAAKQFDRAA